MLGKRYAVVSCHVERPLDAAAWSAFSRLQERRPGGFSIAALVRPPHEGEDRGLWLERARLAATRGPLGQHTHWTSPDHARPTGGDPAARVREEAEWLRGEGLTPRFFCGGGWYIDPAVAATLAGLGYVDCTATAFRPRYLAASAPRLGLAEPAWLRIDETRLLELPSTHSLGMAARACLGALPPYVHVYFHDTELLDRRRAAALRAALVVLGSRCTPTDLERLAAANGANAPEIVFPGT